MGYIYLITCLITMLMYIGQTMNPVKERWDGHIHAAKRLIKYKEDPTIKISSSIKTSYLYNAMAKYGLDNFKFEILIEVNNDQLDFWETRMIEKFGTLVPNGYNLTSGGGHFKHNEVTKQLMSDLAKAKAPEFIDKYRKPETIGLPMNIVSHDKGESRGFAICGHELCSYKSFTIDEFGSMDAAKEAACVFLKELVEKGVKYDCSIKSDKSLPMGITLFRKGYKVRRKINGDWKTKTFEDRTKTLPELLVLAKKYLDEINALENRPETKQ